MLRDRRHVHQFGFSFKGKVAQIQPCRVWIRGLSLVKPNQPPFGEYLGGTMIPRKRAVMTHCRRASEGHGIALHIHGDHPAVLDCLLYNPSATLTCAVYGEQPGFCGVSPPVNETGKRFGFYYVIFGR